MANVTVTQGFASENKYFGVKGTVESGIDVAVGRNVDPGTFGKTKVLSPRVKNVKKE